jgi:ABC-type branched-subunit amino acid transport system ATPase component
MSDIILNIKGITKTFARKIKSGNGHDGIEINTVLDNFCLSVEKGKVTALIGGNGSGKTTLFNIITGLLPANSGNIQFINGKINSLNKKAPDKIARLGIGRLFQEAHIFPELSILDNMLLADNSMYGEDPLISVFAHSKIKMVEKTRMEKAEKIFGELFGDDKILQDRFLLNLLEPARNLSYGQQRLLALSRLFMSQNNKLLLLDEPASGVSPAVLDRMTFIIRKVVEKGTTIFLIEHNMRFMAETSDTCAFIHSGKVELLGNPADVLRAELVKNQYLGI